VGRDPVSIKSKAAEILSCNEISAAALLGAARRQGILPALFEAILNGPPPTPQARIVFHLAWSADEGLRIRDVFLPGKDAILIDVLAKTLPRYSGPPIELFRGGRQSNHEART
jgi:hypothetical protein